jgi:hypothetical protein
MRSTRQQSARLSTSADGLAAKERNGMECSVGMIMVYYQGGEVEVRDGDIRKGRGRARFFLRRRVVGLMSCAVVCGW